MSEDVKFEDLIQAKIDKVVSGFVAGLPERIKAITAAYESQDWSGLRHLTHKLAGAAIFGFPELGEAARQIEYAVEAQQKEGISVLIAQLLLLSEAVFSSRPAHNGLNLLR